MEVRNGYKQTELGVIPEDWDVKEFAEVMDGFSSGQTPYRAKPEFYKGDIPWITSGELNYNIITDTKEKITIEGVQDALLKTIPKGTFLIAITGLEAAGTRGSCATTGIVATTNQSCMALYPKKGLLTTLYLYHFYVRYGNELALKYCQGTKQQSYTGGVAKKLPIIVPRTIQEQKAIAEVLSDTDNLIQALEKQIAKKCKIKQGVMKELLIPKGKWETKRLGDFIKFQTGFPFSSEYFTINPIGKRLVKNRDLRSDDTIVYYTGDYLKEFLVNDGDLLIGMDGDFEPVLWNKGNALLNQRVGRILKMKEISIPYLSYTLLKELKDIEMMTGSTTVKHLSHSDIEKIVMLMPDFNEQTRIATVITDIDFEIKALERKLSKYKSQKQGLLQQLLTGKIRLITT